MGNLAVCLNKAGVEVSGSDAGVYPPISDLLSENRISFSPTEDLGAIEEMSDGIVIVGNAVSRGHPQVEWLMENPSVTRMSFPEFLGSFLVNRTRNLVVAGTHGKSTTTAAASHILRNQQADCGWFVGGVMADTSPAFSWSPDNEFFAIEGDEYDSAFFDKRSKFVHYRPWVLVLNNLEFDHADIFRDTADVQRSFRQCISLVPSSGTILFNGDDERLQALLPVNWTNCRSFGFGENNDYRISRIVEGDVSRIRVTERASRRVKVELTSRLIGSFNAQNLAAAALGVGFLTNFVFENAPVLDLSAFGGLKRRQEIRFETERRILIEDFGHHPTALSLALTALREFYPGWHIHAMVEPRSNTMRTNCLEKELTSALLKADSVTLAPIHRKELISAEEMLDPARVAGTLWESSIECTVCEKDSDLLDAFHSRLGSQKTLTVIFSNGAFGGWLGEFEKLLETGV